MHPTYVALHEVTWCMVVWRTQNVPRCQQFHVVPAMSALWVHHFGGYSKTSHKKLFTHAESQVSAMSLLEGGEQRHIKAINNSNNKASHLQYTAQRVCQHRWDIPLLGLRPPLTKGSPRNSGAERCWSNRHSGAFSPPPPGMWTTVGYHSEVSVRLPGR